MRRAAAAFLAALALSGACPCAAADGRLVDQNGHSVDARELNARWLLVYFGYTSCREICPGTLATMSALLGRLGRAGEAIDPIFVSLDPEHDTPAALRKFAASFHPRLRALTGSPGALAEAARTFNVPWKRVSAELIDHGTFMYLVAPGGHVAQVLHPQEPLEDLAAVIRKRMSAAAAT